MQTIRACLILVSRASPLYRVGSAQALFPHKVVVVFI